MSHRNKVILETFLRVRVEILLHEPLRHKVAFTPLGSKDELEFDVKMKICQCIILVVIS